MRRRIVCLFFVFFGVNPLLAYDPTPAEEQELYLDTSPFISARSAGLGGSLSTLADGIHAPYYNPAGIGGINSQPTPPPFIRELYFPYFAGGADPGLVSFIDDWRSSEAEVNHTGFEKVVAEAANHRQYGRFSTLFSLGLSRINFVPYNDIQFALLPRSVYPANEESTIIHYRSNTGVGLGFSFDFADRLYLGLFSAANSMGTFVTTFNYGDSGTTQYFTQLVDKNLATYSAVDTHAGLIWVMSPRLRPSLGLSVRHLGNTVYGGNANNPFLVDEQDVTLGFSISPSHGKQFFNFIVEGREMLDTYLAVTDKIHAGVEWNMGGFGSDALFSLRSGIGTAGVSYGLSLNIGLIQLELASEAKNFSPNNDPAFDRVYTAVLSVNVLDE